MDKSEAKAVLGEFKGNPTITVFLSGDSRGFTFGLMKARKVLANLDAIRAFVGEDAETQVKAPESSEA